MELKHMKIILRKCKIEDKKKHISPSKEDEMLMTHCNKMQEG